ncbi:MAG: hypothetical protein ACRD40_09435 [Candidatus Acidiferrales bacterium]
MCRNTGGGDYDAEYDLTIQFNQGSTMRGYFLFCHASLAWKIPASELRSAPQLTRGTY